MIVIVKMKNGDFIMGNLRITDESSIELNDALIVEIGKIAAGITVYFYKYCPFNTSFDISLQKSEISNIFDDPIPSLVDYYRVQCKIIKRTYNLKLQHDQEEIEEEEFEEDPSYEAWYEKIKTDPEVH